MAQTLHHPVSRAFFGSLGGVLAAFGISVGICIPGASAQSDPGGPGGPGTYQPLDAAVEDMGELSLSLRQTRVDLRHPLGFDSVYHAPGSDELYMRASGALYAVFDQSQYARFKNGLQAEIPGGTVYYIGAPDFSMPPSRENPETARLRINTRVGDDSDLPADGVARGSGSRPVRSVSAAPGAASENQQDRIGSPTGRGRIPPAASGGASRVPSPRFGGGTTNGDGVEVSGPTIATSEVFRQSRMRELLSYATQAEPPQPPTEADAGATTGPEPSETKEQPKDAPAPAGQARD